MNVSKLVQFKIDGDDVVLETVTVDAIERGGIVGARVERQVREDVALVAETLGRRLRIVSATGEPLPRFLSN